MTKYLQQTLFDAAKKADDEFQAALVAQYGKRAGDMRYRTMDLEGDAARLGKVYREAHLAYLNFRANSPS